MLGRLVVNVAAEAIGPPIKTNPQTGQKTVILTTRPTGGAPEVKLQPVDPAALLPVRLETNGRKCSFMAVEIRSADTQPGKKRPEVSAESTNRLFILPTEPPTTSSVRASLSSAPASRYRVSASLISVY